jgi:hypothetical protein
MAKQTGPNPFIGRRGDLLGYRMAGQYYARIVSSLTAERVLSDPAFKLTMQYAGLLGKASKIASAIYRLLPEQEHGFYRELTGMAMRLLKQGKTGEEAFAQLYNEFIPPALPVKTPKRRRLASHRFHRIVFRPGAESLQKKKSSFCYSLMLPVPPGGVEALPDKKNRLAGASFPDELLKRLFSKPPEQLEREAVSAIVSDHPPSPGAYCRQPQRGRTGIGRSAP